MLLFNSVSKYLRRFLFFFFDHYLSNVQSSKMLRLQLTKTVIYNHLGTNWYKLNEKCYLKLSMQTFRFIDLDSHVERAWQQQVLIKQAKLNRRAWREGPHTNLYYAALHATKPPPLSNLNGVIILYYYHLIQRSKRFPTWHSPLSGCANVSERELEPKRPLDTALWIMPFREAQNRNFIYYSDNDFPSSLVGEWIRLTLKFQGRKTLPHFVLLQSYISSKP